MSQGLGVVITNSLIPFQNNLFDIPQKSLFNYMGFQDQPIFLHVPMLHFEEHMHFPLIGIYQNSYVPAVNMSKIVLNKPIIIELRSNSFQTKVIIFLLLSINILFFVYNFFKRLFHQ